MDGNRRVQWSRINSSIITRSPHSSDLKSKSIPATNPDSPLSPKKPDAKESGTSRAFVGSKVLNANTVAASTIGPKTSPSEKLPAASPVVGAQSTPYDKKSTASPGFLGHKVPNANKFGPAISPPSTSSNSSEKTQGRPTKKNVTRFLRSWGIQRRLLFKPKQDKALISHSTAYQNSPEAALFNNLEELSNMKSSLETTSASVQELFSWSDSKFTEAWKEADRGVKQLEEGLRIITKAQKLLRSPTNITIPEEELH